MKKNETGVLETSSVFFNTASETAQNLFFYLLCCGNYDCDCHYKVDRKNYYSFLLLYVVKGNGFVMQNGKRMLLQEGNFLLVDCYKPHIYGSDSGWKILWCHFDGKLARPWYNRIVETGSLIIKPIENTQTLTYMENLLQPFYNNTQIDEVLANEYITILLTQFLYHSETPADDSTMVNKIIGHINNNLTENLTIEQFADMVCLSPYYFIRLFKKQTGYTPHEYLIHARVNAAQFYLKTTNLSLKEICFNCGFTNESSFSNTFRRITGMTPVTYKNSTSL